MRSLFGGSNSKVLKGTGGPRIARHSSGWAQLRTDLQQDGSLRLLDIGPTSSININYITGLGHSLYMADLVEEASRPEWILLGQDGEPSRFNVEGFLAANLDFAGRTFNAVTLWDTADYLPAELLTSVIARLHSVIEPGGKMLAFFHVKLSEAPPLHRYHLTDSDQVEQQSAGAHPIRQVFNNREIEKLFADFAGYRFFLARDNLREVLVTR